MATIYYDGINPTLKVGDWITQFSVGLWQIVGIYPQYATFDYTCADGRIVKKGDYIDNYILMKKAFTPKMKFRLGAEHCSSRYCQKVNDEALQAIEAYFEKHPSDKRKFDEYEPKFSLGYYNVSYEIDDDEKFAQICDIVKNYHSNTLSITQILSRFENILGHGRFNNNYVFENNTNRVFDFAFEYVGWVYNEEKNSHICKRILIKTKNS